MAATKIEEVDVLRLPLVNRFYSECNYKVNCGRKDRVFIYSENEKIIAAARFILQASGDYILRNVCVAPQHRQQGIATHFLAQALQQLSPNNCYCFTSTPLQHFYETIGFTCFLAEQAPPDIGDIYLRYRERKRGWILMGFENGVV
jgi:N-acetylglutamate synthase-like GNAT family acetyltransferase